MSSESTDLLRQQANDLYWNSSDTVDQIARQLGISRSAMYSSVHPIPVGASCVHCDEPLLFTNRTARAAHTALCPVCEIQVTLGESVQPAPDASSADTEDTPSQEPAEPPATRVAQLKEELSQVPPERAAMIGGAAALGVAVGAAAVRVLRKK